MRFVAGVVVALAAAAALLIGDGQQLRQRSSVDEVPGSGVM